MFISKEALDRIYNRLEILANKINEIIGKQEKITECDVCGCLLRREIAIKGESTVEPKMKIPMGSQGTFGLAGSEEVIIEHYYCKVHKPKK